MSAVAATNGAAIIGGGPAGLMAAEVLAAAGVPVDLYDAMPSLARKFLLAGKGGLNLTHAEPLAAFLGRYSAREALLAPALNEFGPQALRDWAQGLGIDTFVGSSQRVFPVAMKAAPLLRAWLHRLRAAGVRIHVRHRWTGWDASGKLNFATPSGDVRVSATATVLALGGASWPRLGSDGAWTRWLEDRGVPVSPLRPANCGFTVSWSTFLRERHAGEPLKGVQLSFMDTLGRLHSRKGECLISEYGIEGNLVYAVAAALRDTIAAQGTLTVHVDLLPDWTAARVSAEVAHPRGARSLASHLQSRLGLKGLKVTLLREVLSPAEMNDPATLATAIKALPLTLTGTRPIDEAISSAGGVPFEALDEHLMLKNLPGVFCAGEMLDWEAPTGGYLLTACFATGKAAGAGAFSWLARAASAPATAVR